MWTSTTCVDLLLLRYRFTACQCLGGLAGHLNSVSFSTRLMLDGAIADSHSVRLSNSWLTHWHRNTFYIIRTIR